MTQDSARAADVLADHRDSIDRLDAILVYTWASGSSTRRPWAA